jgi:hypothetical protein
MKETYGILSDSVTSDLQGSGILKKLKVPVLNAKRRPHKLG